ncbi:MAG: helix-turn-helix domain-containing protein, partial [Solirubrobacteraceae bacterium]
MSSGGRVMDSRLSRGAWRGVQGIGSVGVRRHPPIVSVRRHDRLSPYAYISDLSPYADNTQMPTPIISIRDLTAAVRGRRQKLGLSQADVARLAGVSRQWVSEFESGKPTAELCSSSVCSTRCSCPSASTS